MPEASIPTITRYDNAALQSQHLAPISFPRGAARAFRSLIRHLRSPHGLASRSSPIATPHLFVDPLRSHTLHLVVYYDLFCSFVLGVIVLSLWCCFYDVFLVGSRNVCDHDCDRIDVTECDSGAATLRVDKFSIILS